MCQIIESDFVIGNLIIEAVQNKEYELKIEDIFEMNERLNLELKKKDAVSNLSLSKLLTFSENYPYFVAFCDENMLKIDSDSESNLLSRRLKQYFQIGFPQEYLHSIKETAKTLFAVSCA